MHEALTGAGLTGTGSTTVGRWRTTALLGTAAAALALLLVMCGFPSGGATDPGGSRRAGGDRVNGAAKNPSGQGAPALGWGFTHTEFSAERGGPDARKRAEKLLSAQPMPQNQHIMGWGANNPEESPGRYDFDELDSRVALMRRTGGTPVITLCCAPDWMKGGKAGETDWSKKQLETAPSPEHYKDFAKLAGKVAERYPDVRHFIVWNEFKGFFDNDKNRWNYEGYTKLYNLVYQELKKVDKDNRIGGPYVVMDSYGPGEDTHDSGLKGPWGSVDQRSLDAVTYWNEHKAGADFLVVDGSSYTKDDKYVPDEFAATEKFADVSRRLRKETGLPLWWAEWYVELADKNDDRNGWSEKHRTAVQAAAMMAMAEGGATTGFYWNPENQGAACPGCLWSSTGLGGGDGGRELPMMKLLARFSHEFGPGTRFDRSVAVAADDKPDVRVLADDEATLVVNILGRPIKARIDGRTFDMGAYGVRWLRR
ncbi:xylan 1,4-beta-xylosidase [Streptomyces sp. H27-D2]|uniref:xylan 1,4-beta-xylosidase n=1 Tax=Streptomyces sp. H27-D2 TaxID=3046304 RepID=UPI002DBEE3A4|nr:xylan 1,4-beta-xylosidase [Streptomyces sp. H27-D2]MEC4020758.1 xylan 1,4-beta-xylosidase [Streptomyces sp. H27-D2]